ncbi:hypothetical protein FAB82_16500 [Glycomyces buryatensis]|uniref:Uncharacterized protein n=1 Tax=Glycomyces buryatensis TaxID=2570927 RepID=A0A4S8Q6Q3_9ACTN|nr:hypothetical protein FAB82_16500 [Glycomyces buryatensis]
MDIFFPSRPGFQWVLVIAGLISCLAGAAVVDRTQKVQFTYDRSSRTIRARDRLWGTWRTYPRKNFERLERSTDPRGVFEVRADGERHRLDIGGGLAHPDDWKTFLECFLEDHAARDTPPDPDTTHT